VNKASVTALVLVGLLLVVLGVRTVPDATETSAAIGGLALIALGEVALIAAGVLQVVGIKRA